MNRKPTMFLETQGFIALSVVFHRAKSVEPAGVDLVNKLAVISH